MDQTFTLLPLHMDPSSKGISSPSLPNDAALTTALSNLNTLHRTLLTLPNATPPPPVPTNPKRSAQIQKMREQANTTMKKAANNPSQAQGTPVAPLSNSLLHYSGGCANQTARQQKPSNSIASPYKSPSPAPPSKPRASFAKKPPSSTPIAPRPTWQPRSGPKAPPTPPAAWS